MIAPIGLVTVLAFAHFWLFLNVPMVVVIGPYMPFAIENMPLDGPVAKYGDAYGLAAHAIAGFCDI